MLISKSNSCPKCGSGHTNDCFAQYENGWYCFSCGASQSNSNDWSYKPRALQHSNVYLPKAATKDWNKMSLEVQEWLIKYYVHQELIDKYNIMYVPFDKFLLKSGKEYCGDSLIFPVVDNNNEILYYQRRFFPNKQILTVGDSQALFVIKSSGFSDKIVLVEDYISALRVGQVSDCMCLFGTKLKSHQLQYILDNYTNVAIWLDADEPGQEAAKKIQSKFYQVAGTSARMFSYRPHTFTIRNICNAQPKELTNTKISTILSSDISNS